MHTSEKLTAQHRNFKQNLINPMTNLIADHEAERLAQLNYGREKLVLPKKQVNSKSKTANAGSKYPQVERRKSQKTGHESMLSKVVSERRKITILFADTNRHEVTGELLEFDKYSIRIRENEGRCVWYFKSAIAGLIEESREG